MADKQLEAYVAHAHSRGLHEQQIIELIRERGWSASDAIAAVKGDDLVPPAPANYQGDAHTMSTEMRHTNTEKPIAVVQNLSTRGFEYSIMFLSLWISAVSLGALGHIFVSDTFSKASNDYYYGDTNPLNTFFITALLVSFPIFAWLFLRLKKAELGDANLRQDPSRRKLIHMTQLVSFIFGMGYIIYFVFNLLNADRYNAGPSFAEQFSHTLVTLAIAGGIFVYYWRDDHKKEQ